MKACCAKLLTNKLIIRVIALIFFQIIYNILNGQSQNILSVKYDISGNRLNRKLQGSSSNLTITATPSAVSLNQTCTLVALGCPGTIKWANGQQGASISVTPTTTTQYSAECITANCTNNGIGQVTVEVFQCQLDAIGVTSNVYTTRYGQSVTLTAYGCPGTVQWSNGKTGFTTKLQIYGASNTFTASCSKRNCPNSGSGSIQITGVTGCAPGDVIITAQAGNWDAPTTWTCGRVPTASDEVLIIHPVTVNGITVFARTLTLGGGYVVHQNGGFVNLQPF